MAPELRAGISPAMVLIVVIVGQIAIGLVTWWEWQRPTPRRRLRMLLAVVATLMLVAIAMRFERRVDASGNTVLLVTSGAAASEIAEAQRTTTKAQTFTLAADAATERRVLGDLVSRTGRAGRARIVGWGPTPVNWELLDGWSVTGTPSAVPFGVADLVAPTTTEIGNRVTIRGRLSAAAPAQTTVVLRGPDGARDSMTIAAGARDFYFGERPRAVGLWTYTVGLNGGRAPSDSIAIDVRAHHPIGVMLLADAPSFELNAARRWLEQRGERIVLRTRVSREKYVNESVNVARNGSTRLDASSLSDVQVIVADPDAISALSTGERAALRTAVRERGAGLLMLGTTEAANQALGNAVVPALPVTEAAEEQLSRAHIAGSDSVSRTVVPLAAVRMVARDGDAVPVRDNSSAPLAVARPLGRGVVGVTAITASTRWLLDGEQSTFDEYWTALLNATVGPRSATAWHTVADARPVVDVPVTLTRITADSERTVLVTGALGDSDTLHAVVASDDSTRLVLRWWPRKVGIHRIASSAGEATMYVGSSGATSPRAAAARADAFAERLHQDPAKGHAATDSAQWQPTSAMWLLIICVACAGALWGLERWGG